MSLHLLLDKVQEVCQIQHIKNVFGIKKSNNDYVMVYRVL